MDQVRFGRALGKGARLAARTVYEALDAATAPSPSSSPRAGSSQPPRPAPRTEILPPDERQTTVRRPSAQGTQTSSTRAKKAGFFAPVRRASRAVSLEITGSFFALFALAFAVAVWHSRAALTAGGPARSRLIVYCAVTLLFGYFAVSNFARARRLP